MANPIVTVVVSQQQAPTPNTLQKTGAMISQGGTSLPPGSSALIQQPADLAVITKQPLPLTTVAWGAAYGGQVTATCGAPHGLVVGARFQTVISGVIPSGYNGMVWALATSTDQFTYPRPINPGAQTDPGEYSPPASGELSTMVTTFFAQGFQQGVYVLELGAGDAEDGVAALQSYINNNEQIFYSYLVPRAWDANPDFLAFLATFEHDTAKTYFFVTTTLTTFTAYQPTMKNVIALVEAPKYGTWARTNALTSSAWTAGKVTHTMAASAGVKPGDWVTLTGFLPAAHNGTFMAQPGTLDTALVVAHATNPGTTTQQGALAASVYASPGTSANEFTMAAAWWVTLNYSPGATSRVPPYSYSFLHGVTRFPSPGNQVVMQVMKTGHVNYVGFGAEGGISDDILLYGHCMDGRPFNYWFSVDWMQIHIQLNIANAIINGSNTTVNPLYYNQDGINRLAGVASNTGASGISFGLALGRVVQVGMAQEQFIANLNNGVYAGSLVVNAEPFTDYLTKNPSHYAQGLYGGLTMAYTPARGFEHIIFSIIATDFVASAV